MSYYRSLPWSIYRDFTVMESIKNHPQIIQPFNQKPCQTTKSLNVPTLKASEWLPDTKVMKEQLASAASQIKTAVGDMEGQPPARADSQPRGASAQALTSSSSTLSSSGSSAPADEEPLVVQDMSQARRVTTPQPGAINLRESPRHRQDSASAERRRQQPPLPSQTASQQSTPTEARDVCSLSIRI